MPDVIHVLYMEDDTGLARLLQRRLERAGYAVDIAIDGQEGLAKYQTNRYDVLLIDQRMPGREGIEVIRILAANDTPPPMIMVTGTGNEPIAVEAMKLGAADYIVKDAEGGYFELLPAVINKALYNQRLLEEKRQAEKSLQKYMVDLQEHNQELDAFSHTVAHDLKSPLAQIVGLSSLVISIFDDLSNEEILHHLQSILDSGQRMNNIIDELLLLASVRKQAVTTKSLKMEQIVENAKHRLDFMIEKHQAHIIEPAAWPAAIGYGPWVEEVWVNYVSNAIKYGGQPPSVTLGANTQPDGRVRFWVRDNGPGLSTEEQSKLFIPFTRLSQIRAEGYGLGLSIVRRIIEKLNGDVGVESEVGRGSTFYFILPAG